VINHVSLGINLLCTIKTIRKIKVSCLLLSTPGGYKRFTLGGRDTLRKVGLHDTEGVRCTLARFSSVMYGIVLGVTPSDTLRRMNQDNIVCCTLTSNIMNDYEHDMNTITI